MTADGGGAARPSTAVTPAGYRRASSSGRGRDSCLEAGPSLVDPVDADRCQGGVAVAIDREVAQVALLHARAGRFSVTWDRLPSDAAMPSRIRDAVSAACTAKQQGADE